MLTLAYIHLSLFLLTIICTFVFGSLGKQARHLLNIPLWYILFFEVPMKLFPKFLIIYFVMHFIVWAICINPEIRFLKQPKEE